MTDGLWWICFLYITDFNMSQVANLTWIERKGAAAICAEPPTATYPEAMEHCLKAESLSPTPCKENRLLLAKCHFSQSNYVDAVRWLNRASQVPVVTPYVSQNIISSSYMHWSNSVKVFWHFIISMLCWTLSNTWGVFDTNGVMRVGCTLILRCLVVIKLTCFCCWMGK